MGFQQYRDARFTYETADPDDADFDSGYYSSPKPQTQYPPIRPNKPHPSFAERWNEKHAPRRGNFILSGQEPLPLQLNPDPGVYKFADLVPERRRKIERLGFDEPALMPVADPSGVET